MHAEQWTSQADDLFKRCSVSPASVTVVCDAMDEGGFKWRKGATGAGLVGTQEAAAERSKLDCLMI